jgi:hypothetical protein
VRPVSSVPRVEVSLILQPNCNHDLCKRGSRPRSQARIARGINNPTGVVTSLFFAPEAPAPRQGGRETELGASDRRADFARLRGTASPSEDLDYDATTRSDRSFDRGASGRNGVNSNLTPCCSQL